MKTARETKLEIIKRLASMGMTQSDVVEWDPHLEEDEGPPFVCVYFSWFGGGDAASFPWPWGRDAFSRDDYETYFARG